MTEVQAKRKLSALGYRLIKLEVEHEPPLYAILDPSPWPVYRGKQFRFAMEEISRMIEENTLETFPEAESGIPEEEAE